MDQPVPSQPKLPAGLAGMLNDEPEENRDSAYFSGPDASSKRMSSLPMQSDGVCKPHWPLTAFACRQLYGVVYQRVAR